MAKKETDGTPGSDNSESWYEYKNEQESDRVPSPAIDQILDAVAGLGLLEDYQLANLAEFLEAELHQKATTY